MASDNVQFDEDQIDYSRRSTRGAAGGQPRMVQWFIDKGIVKSPNAAKGLMVGIVIIDIMIIVYILMHYL
jgi:hypothetical protein